MEPSGKGRKGIPNSPAKGVSQDTQVQLKQPKIVSRMDPHAAPFCPRHVPGPTPPAVTDHWLEQAAAVPARADQSPADDIQEPFSVIDEFNFWRSKPELAVATAAIKALVAVIKRSDSNTMMGLERELKNAVEILKACDRTSISLSAACDLFMRYVTRNSTEDTAAGKAHLIERGEQFSDISQQARLTIALLGADFVRDGATILTHGFSRVTLQLLKVAASKGKNFSVICTEGRPTDSGIRLAKELALAGIPVTLVPDPAVAVAMERVDMVMVGTEGVVESGGIINIVGTYQIALVARAMGKPFYVAAESYKFARMYPLDQRDLQEGMQRFELKQEVPHGVFVESPSKDYTPPNFLTLLFTDLGVLTPSAVSDELIQLYL